MSRGVTQDELAAAVGISVPTYRRLERGQNENPKLRHLVNCAIALGVSLGDVVEESWMEWLPLDAASAEPPARDEFWRRPYRPKS
jgi:transcriptional regulator with XRE-family HTH domain